MAQNGTKCHLDGNKCSCYALPIPGEFIKSIRLEGLNGRTEEKKCSGVFKRTHGVGCSFAVSGEERAAV